MRLMQKFLLGAQLYCILPLKSILAETTSSTLYTTSKPILAMSQQQTCTSSTSSSSSLYESGSASVIFVTTPDENSAKKIAHALVTEKLAACVNLIPNLTSIYHWEGKINEDSEILLMIKTKTNRIDELTKFVRENHPYSVAEVISLPIQNGNQPYLDWILKTVPDKK